MSAGLPSDLAGAPAEPSRAPRRAAVVFGASGFIGQWLVKELWTRA